LIQTEEILLMWIVGCDW